MKEHSQNDRNRRYKREEGVVSLEFVILFPLFMLILAGIVEFGHLFYVRHTLTNASREAARAAVVYVTGDRQSFATTTATTTVNEYLNPVKNGVTSHLLSGVTVAPPEITVSGGGATGSTVTVRITATNVFLVVDSLISLSEPITVSAETTMRME